MSTKIYFTFAAPAFILRRMLKNLSFLVISISAALVSGATPPGQPLLGPGGTTYPYSSVVPYGPFNDGPACPGTSCNQGLTYYIYQPSRPLPLLPLPLVLFLHGYSADDPNIYMNWIYQIVQMGNTVIWTNWDANGTAGGDTVINNEITSFQNAITRIQSDLSYIQPQVNAHGVIRAVIAGHSGGAFTGFRVAALSWTASTGIPPIRAVAAINPGQGQLPDYDISGLDPSVKAVIVVGADESVCEQYVGAKVYDLLTMLPITSKSFLEAFTDNHGSPGLSSQHNFPATLTPLFTLDDMDFSVSFKLSVALFDCALFNSYCSMALSNGPAQTGMGSWSDGTPVTPLSHFTTDPLLTFPFNPYSGCTQ